MGVVGLGLAGFALTALFAMSLFACLLPLMLRRRLSGSHPVFQLADAFAAGVLTAAALVHLLPDAHEGFPANFPYAGACAAAGACLLYLLDALADGFGTAYILAASLIVHSLLEGVALGASTGKTTLFGTVLLAIAAHKAFAAFALGTAMVAEGVCVNTMRVIALVFALASPLGAASALLIVRYLLTGAAGKLVTSIFTSLSAGIFLYVALVELMSKKSVLCHGDQVLDRLPEYGAAAAPANGNGYKKLGADADADAAAVGKRYAPLRAMTFVFGAAGMTIVAIIS